jgi:hypothetical protein
LLAAAAAALRSPPAELPRAKRVSDRSRVSRAKAEEEGGEEG